MESAFITESIAHHVLIGINIFGTIICGSGIIWESAPEGSKRKRVATRLVILGIALECVSTISLLEYDESISRGQRDKIIELETRIAPRHIDKDQQSIIANALRGFPAPEFDLCITPGVEEDFITELRETLVAGGWTIRNFGGKLATPEQLIVPDGKIPGIGVCGSTGVNIFMDPKLGPRFGQSAAVVRLALSKLGIAASAYTMETDEHMRADMVHVQIGSRL
jgi:hypothetical protein